MQTNLSEAKRRLVINVASNVAVVFLTAIINIWLTPYYIKHLDVDGYGMIPLAVSFIAFFRIFSMSISNAIGRFVMIELGKKKIDQGNLYFNTALVSVVLLSAISLVPLIVLAINFTKVFNIPIQYKDTAGIFFFCVTSSTFFISLSECFRVSTLYTHRFDLYNLVQILSRFLRMGAVVTAFSFISVSLVYVGASYLLMAFFCLFFAIFFTRRLTPEICIKPSLFKWSAFKEMAPMSSWMILNEVGSLFYISISFVIVNILLGSKATGYYGPIAQLVSVVTILGWTVCNVFTPIAYDYISRNDLAGLTIQVHRLVKFMSLIAGILIAIMCGFSKPILYLWLGEDFTHLQPLLWVMMIPWFFSVSMMPLISVYKGLNKVKAPTLATLGLGVLNVLLAVLLINFTELGLYGIAIAMLISLAGKHLLFSPIYLSMITGDRPLTLLFRILPAATMTIVLAGTAVLATRYISIDSLPRLIVATLALSATYGATSYLFVLNKSDRGFIVSILGKNKRG